jgi:energy-coupling factor transporter ATP-binding protein EcfA2
MRKGALKSLTVEHLRGSISSFTLSFEKGKNLTVIYGENGTGKSTICDAFDFLGKGNVGSLDNRGLGKTNKYWHSIGKSPNDVLVKLESTTGICSATFSKKGAVLNPPDEQPRIEVLRRSQILSLIEAKPSERYSAISHFIDVSAVEKSETTLRQLIKSIENNTEVAIARVQENRDSIQRFWEQAGKPANNALDWARVETQRDQQTLDLQRTAIEILKTSFNKLLDYPSQYNAQIKCCETADSDYELAQYRIDELKTQAANEYFEILDVLQAAQRHFASHPNPMVCPLCESAENIIGLPGKINTRIASHNIANQLKSAQITADTKWLAVSTQKQRLTDLLNRALIDAERLVQASQSEHLPKGVGLPKLPFPGNIGDWEEWLDEAKELVIEWDKISDECIDSKKFINTLKTSLLALQQNTSIQYDLDNVLPRLKEALEVAENERRKFTDQILHNIAIEVGRLYEAVHPGEGLNKISLELDPIKRASLEITTEFNGLDDTPPQAYFSDSHLDTLGLCVFLALAKMESPEETVLVLDDVLGSIDEPHVDRLIEMLYTEATVFKHCIITTHYRPWKQKLRWGWLKNGQCQFVELSRWTSSNGISLIRSIPDIERLRALLEESPPDPQLVCAKSGVILEATLDFLTLLYECHVPRRTDGTYTLGDLLPAIDKKLRNALRVEHKQEQNDGTIVYIEKVLAPHLEELSRIAQLRNVFGCHFNAISFHLLDTDAIAFGKEVLALIDCLIDHEAGWPRNSKSGSYWATAGETRRLHPLKKPSN